MTEPLIYSVGTQVVVQKETYHVNRRIAHPAGSVGVIVRSPIDRTHAYRVKFNDGFEASVHHDQLIRLSEFKRDPIRGSAETSMIVLALKANPNVLECLYSPIVEFATPLADELLAMRESFLSKLVFQTYSGYVASQFKKMQTDIRNQGRVKWKHVMHLIRLLISGIDVLREGKVTVEVGQQRSK